MSDHGFHPDHLRPQHLPNEPAGPAAEHRPYGILVMKGPGLRRDERVYRATVLDIAPTICNSSACRWVATWMGELLAAAHAETTRHSIRR